MLGSKCGTKNLPTRARRKIIWRKRADIDASLDDDDLLMEELDRGGSGEKLLEIARRFKAKRLRFN